MIWHDEEIKVQDQPDEAIVRLVGTYTPDDHPSIKLTLHVTGQQDLLMFSHHPNGLAHEEPTSSEIKTRYLHKIGKIHTRLAKTPYAELKWIKQL